MPPTISYNMMKKFKKNMVKSKNSANIYNMLITLHDWLLISAVKIMDSPGTNPLL